VLGGSAEAEPFAFRGSARDEEARGSAE